MKLLAAIQAGGRSRRMGQDKAWLDIKGRPMIEHVLTAAQPLAQRIAIVISQPTPEPNRYAALAAKWQADLLIDAYDHCGPLGGIVTALRHCKEEESALILACDLPFLTTEFLQLLIPHPSSLIPHPLTIPEDRTGRPQMLCGLYDAGCLPFAEQLLAENKLRVVGLCALVATQTLRWTDYAHLANAERLLLNCNTPDDFRTDEKSPTK
ncbi:MAG: molybdenum cofactor guanylyltransferase [Acidobacteria bacterium]|nr:molybdenum cofactor guanylyltransferase [Acidobacteriota bacterium]